MRSFSGRLLKWWDNHGRKDLPWQQPRSAYRVWLSEIMLQQTQVATVIPYFTRFVDSFPDISTLAEASQDQVLAHWSGLGYYARARNLHATAKICVNDYQADLPNDAENLKALPGIGPSTANAIISQAWDQPAAIVDGNVKRVLCRHDAIEGWPGKTAVQKQVWAAAEQRLPNKRGADYTQAIMDLGATLCTRNKPLCEQCPVQVDCTAYQQDTVQQFPTPKPKRKNPVRNLYMLILVNANHRILLEKRPPTGIWGGLWSLPEAETIESFSTGLAFSSPKEMQVYIHRFTHYTLEITPVVAQYSGSGRQIASSGEQRWCDYREFADMGLPTPIKRILEQHRTGRQS